MSHQWPRLSRIRRLYLIDESLVSHTSGEDLSVRSIVGRYSLLGVFLFVISLASTLSLGVRYGYGENMLFSIVPFNIACFVSLCSVRVRFAHSVAAGAIGGGFGLLVGAAGLSIVRPQAFRQFGVLMFAFPAVDGTIMGAVAGILVWTMYAVLKRDVTSGEALLLKSCSVVIALTVVSMSCIFIAEVFK